MKVLFVVPYPSEGPSVRYRIELYLPYLAAHGVEAMVSRFASPALYRLLSQPGYVARKALHSAAGMARRIADGLRLGRFDVVAVHLEACPIGPPVFERMWAGRKPLLFDVDDAIYMANRHGANRALHFLKDTSKVPEVIRISRRVTVCNDHLKDYAAQYTDRGRIDMIPTSVDTARFAPGSNGAPHPVPVLGWVGSYTTSPYLDLMAPALQALAARRRFILRVVGAGRPVRIPGVEVDERPWTLAREIADFQSLDVGLYPLPDDEWCRGKTGFKVVQYMACGVPCVASRVGRNVEIIRDGENGFLAWTTEDWVEKIDRLLEDAALRRRFGEAGRATVEDRFSERINAPKFLASLERALSG